MQKIFNYYIEKLEDGDLFKTATAYIYVRGNALYIEEPTRKLFYEFGKGWHQENIQTHKSYFLGEGACPVVDLDVEQIPERLGALFMPAVEEEQEDDEEIND